MTDTKRWYQSKTIWGVIIAMISPILATATHNGIQILPAGQDQLADLLSEIGTAFGGILAILGRASATTTITSTPTPPPVIKSIVLMILVGALAGCQGIGQQVGTFTVSDIQQAQAAAQASNDTVALDCYKVFLPIAQRVGDPAYQPKGIVGLVQMQRDLQQIKTALSNACGPIAMDLLMSLNKFGP